MHRRVCGRPLLCRVVLVVALVALLGHVCAFETEAIATYPLGIWLCNLAPCSATGSSFVGQPALWRGFGGGEVDRLEQRP